MSKTRVSKILSSGNLPKRARILDLMESISIRSEKGSNTSASNHSKDSIAEEVSHTDLFSLTFLNASLFATILEDTITSLRILNECNNEFRLMKTMMDIQHLIAVKYNVKQPAVTDELAGIDPKNLGKEAYKLHKLTKDRKCITEALLYTYLDLSLNKSFLALGEQVISIWDKEDYRENLVAEEESNRAIRRELGKQLRLLRNHNKSAQYDQEVLIDELRTQVEDAGLNSEISRRYNISWEVARREQHETKIKNKENPKYSAIDECKQLIENEQRVHSEVVLLVHMAVNEIMEQVENIMTKYDRDMEAIDLKLQILSGNLDDAKENRRELEDMMDNHKKEIDAWINFKDERTRAHLYREKMEHSAIVVQAWWRGLLVRMQMGPFLVSKKAKAAAAAKKKTKKK